MSFLRRISIVAVAVGFGAVASVAGAVELAENGGFETGDFTGWTLFPTGPGQQNVTNVNPSSGTYSACIQNDVDASNSLIKNDNIGIGQVSPGATVTISFDARGGGVDGGVAFAEFFSEIDGGGTSSSEILGGAPLALNANPDVWTTFNFVTVAGPDVSGGVTIQFGAATAAIPTSAMTLCIDNVSVSVEGAVSVDPSSWGQIKNDYR